MKRWAEIDSAYLRLLSGTLQYVSLPSVNVGYIVEATSIESFSNSYSNMTLQTIHYTLHLGKTVLQQLVHFCLEIMI